MFEVGKKYKGRVTSEIAECVYVCPNTAFMVLANGNGFATDPWNYNKWTEYKEPCRVRAWLHVIEVGDKAYLYHHHYASREDAEEAARPDNRFKNQPKVLDIIEIDWTGTVSNV